MGRPINKRYFGALGAPAANIPVESAFIGEAKIAEGGASIFIVRQRSARRFEVQNVDDGSKAVCRLVNKAADDSTSVVEGEMVIVGYDADGIARTIRSMTNRIATDFNNNRYTWTVEDDSTTSVLRLTAI